MKRGKQSHVVSLFSFRDTCKEEIRMPFLCWFVCLGNSKEYHSEKLPITDRASNIS